MTRCRDGSNGAIANRDQPGWASTVTLGPFDAGVVGLCVREQHRNETSRDAASVTRCACDNRAEVSRTWRASVVAMLRRWRDGCTGSAPAWSYRARRRHAHECAPRKSRSERLSVLPRRASGERAPSRQRQARCPQDSVENRATASLRRPDRLTIFVWRPQNSKPRT